MKREMMKTPQFIKEERLSKASKQKGELAQEVLRFGESSGGDGLAGELELAAMSKEPNVMLI